MTEINAPARYADGLAAVTHEADVHVGAEAILFRIGGGGTAWHYDQIRRVDDDNGQIILRQEPDTGERLIFDADCYGPALRSAAPSLFTDHAHGRESWRLLGALAGAAGALAILFLVGVPLAAKPLARFLPSGYADRLGAIAWAQVDASGQRCNAPTDAIGEAALTRVAQRLARTTRQDTREHLSITVVSAAPGSPLAQPNAFALPGGSIVITRPMIDFVQNPEELAGVMAHEIGHVDERHVMANVIRNIGVGAFFDVVFSGSGVGQAIALASVNLANLGYSRGDEADADRRGFDFMEAAGYNPAASAALFDRLAATEGQGRQTPIFLQNHPATRGRAEAARARAHPAREIAFTPAEWASVRAMCSGGAGPGNMIAPLPPSAQQSGDGPAPLPPNEQPQWPSSGGPAPLPPGEEPQWPSSSGPAPLPPSGAPGKSAPPGLGPSSKYR